MIGKYECKEIFDNYEPIFNVPVPFFRTIRPTRTNATRRKSYLSFAAHTTSVTKRAKPSNPLFSEPFVR